MADDKDKKEDLAKNLCALHKKRTSGRSLTDNLNQKVADYIAPRKSNFNNDKVVGDEWTDDLYDTTAIDASNVYAAGVVTETTPASERWFLFEPPEVLKRDGEIAHDAKVWFETVSEITAQKLEESNFYTQIYEAHKERGDFGTCSTFIDEGKRSALYFNTLAWGTYCIGVDEEGYVNQLSRSKEYTADQAKGVFGEDNLPKEVKDLLGKSTDKDKKFEFIHFVLPREDKDREFGKIDPENKAIASYYIFACKDKEEIVLEGGYDEMPYATSRYEILPGDVWGWSAGQQALPLVRQTNFLESNLDAFSETQSYPRILMPDGYTERPNLQASGITQYDPMATNVPQAWATEGRPDSSMERSDVKQRQIRKIYHNELFQMFADIEPGKMTAFETMKRDAEKLNLFSPTFQLINNEMLSPILSRVFGILFRAGAYPEPPASVFIPTESGVALAMPKIAYQSRIALALKALKNGAIVDFFAVLGAVFELQPEIADNFEWDTIAPDVARSLGWSPQWIKDPKKRDAEREARAEQEQREHQAAMIESMTKSAGQMGNAPPQLQEAAGEVINI
jgi:hypothetical protein